MVEERLSLIINAQQRILYYNIRQITCLVVAMYKDNAKVGRLQPASILYCHVVPLADVVDVNRNASISTWMAEDSM